MDDIGLVADELEDGELGLGLSDLEYNPLPRPVSDLGLGLPKKIESSNTSSICTTNSGSTSHVAYNSDSDAQESSDSDDSDGPKRSKVPRMRPNLIATKNTKPNKYNIWSQHLQESVLNEQLLNCDVDTTAYDKSRNVESYNYVSLARFEDDERQTERSGSISPFADHSRPNKRRYKDRGNVHKRLGHRRPSPTENRKGSSRQICDLKVTEADTPEDIATDIANKLYEEKESLILKTIQVLGVQKAIGLFTKTKVIEGDGGMMILNGARRRTPGGVYFFLLRGDDDVTPEQKNLIFGEDAKAYNSKRKHDRCQKRREKARVRMENLKKEGLCSVSALPNLLTRAEQVVKKLAEAAPEQAEMHVEEEEEEEGEIDKRLEDSDEMEKAGEESDGAGKCGEEGVSNPPPSPATDNRENSSDEVPELGDRKVLSYADDFLDIGTDDMDVF